VAGTHRFRSRSSRRRARPIAEDVVDPLDELSVAKLEPLAAVAVPATPLTVEPADAPVA
jgi:hypothetical protein